MVAASVDVIVPLGRTVIYGSSGDHPDTGTGKILLGI